MGKAKKNENEAFSFVVELKSVVALKPEQRVKWLSKALRAVADGEASVKHVFDVLSNKKLTQGFHVKVGRRMFRVVRDNLYLFSEKQQRYLSEESNLALEFAEEDKSDDEAEASKENPKPEVALTHVTSDAAARMEEMMARCRDFVRQNASAYDDRTREVQEAERRAAEEKRKAATELRRLEWEAIDKWHRQMETWEVACMTVADERLPILEALKALEEEKAANSNGLNLNPLGGNSSSSRAGNKGGTKRKRRSAQSSSEEEIADVLRPKDRQKDRDRDRDRDRDQGKDRDRDRDRDRGRDNRRGTGRGLSGQGLPAQPILHQPVQAAQTNLYGQGMSVQSVQHQPVQAPDLFPARADAVPAVPAPPPPPARRRFKEAVELEQTFLPARGTVPPASAPATAAAAAAANALNGTLADLLRGR